MDDRQIALGQQLIAFIEQSPASAFELDREAWHQLVSGSSPGLQEITDALWAAVAASSSGVVRIRNEVLVAKKALVMQVFGDSVNYSVKGYAARMAKSFGLIYLGLDAGADYDRQSTDINNAIMRITEADAFRLALDATRDAIGATGSGAIDIGDVSTRVLAAICENWFNLPGTAAIIVSGAVANPCPPARLPGHWASPSGYIFQPHPPGELAALGRWVGAKILKPTVLEFVEASREPGKTPTGPLSSVLFAAFPNSRTENDLLARTIIGVLMGMLPTVDGNLTTTVNEWLKNGGREFDRLRTAFLADPDPDLHARAVRILREELIKSMQKSPVPKAVWRTAITDHELGSPNPVQVRTGDVININIAAATQEDLGNKIVDEMPIFGGDRRLTTSPPTHGCPGVRAALGLMLGTIAGLMEDASRPLVPANLSRIQM